MKLTFSDQSGGTIEVEDGDEVWLAKCAASYYSRSRLLDYWVHHQNEKPDERLHNYPITAPNLEKGEKPQIIHRPEEVSSAIISLLKTAFANATIDLATFKFVNGNVRDKIRNKVLNKAVKYCDLDYQGIDDIINHVEGMLKAMLKPPSERMPGEQPTVFDIAMRHVTKEVIRDLIVLAAQIAIYILNSFIKSHSPYEIGFAIADSQYPESEWEKYEQIELAKIEAPKKNTAKKFFRGFFK